MKPGHPGISYINTGQLTSRKVWVPAGPPMTFTVTVGDDGTVGVSVP